MLTTFKHRNITSLLGIGVEDGAHKYIILELMNEGSLKSFLTAFKNNRRTDGLHLDESHFSYIAAQVQVRTAHDVLQWYTVPLLVRVSLTCC